MRKNALRPIVNITGDFRTRIIFHHHAANDARLEPAGWLKAEFPIGDHRV